MFRITLFHKEQGCLSLIHILQQEESPDEEIISRIEAELTQLTAEETQNREALAEAEARLNEADAALESVQSQREEAARTAAQAAEQAEQARNDARHAYEKSVEAASETAAANAASATVLAEQIREMESSVETLKKLDEQEGVFCAPQTGTVESLQLMQGPVSYTHLDVYKRQASRSGIRRAAALRCRSRSHRRDIGRIHNRLSHHCKKCCESLLVFSQHFLCTYRTRNHSSASSIFDERNARFRSNEHFDMKSVL